MTDAAGRPDDLDAPLAGMRVIEMSSYVAAPLGGMTLAQLGADVIKVDDLRGGPDRGRWPLAPSGESLYWAGLNKGKRSVTVDLRSDQGRALVAELVRAGGPDGGIVLTNTGPRPGLSYDELRELRPDVILLHLLGRHDGGPAVDYTVNTQVGFPAMTGPEGYDGPVNHVLPAWDIACGLHLAVALLAAERRRRRTGRGERIAVALQDVAMAMTGNLGFLAQAQFGEARPRIGNYLYGDFGRDFATADGRRIMLIVLTARHWNDLVAATGLAGPVAEVADRLGADLTRDGDRYAAREELSAILAPWFAARTVEEIGRAFSGRSMLWSEYRDLADLAKDGAAALRAEPVLAELDQPGIGRHLAPGSPLVFGGWRPPPRPAPALGQHTDEVLRELLALPADRIDELRARNVIGG